MEREHKPVIPKAAKFPLFILGLAIMILGGLEGLSIKASASQETAIVAVGFVILILSIVLN